MQLALYIHSDLSVTRQGDRGDRTNKNYDLRVKRGIANWPFLGDWVTGKWVKEVTNENEEVLEVTHKRWC